MNGANEKQVDRRKKREKERKESEITRNISSMWNWHQTTIILNVCSKVTVRQQHKYVKQ